MGNNGIEPFSSNCKLEILAIKLIALYKSPLGMDDNGSLENRTLPDCLQSSLAPLEHGNPYFAVSPAVFRSASPVDPLLQPPFGNNSP